MPLYEFYCPKCEKICELLQKYDDPLPMCDECKIEMERIISKSTFILKGSGWAKDGYSKKSTKQSKTVEAKK